MEVLVLVEMRVSEEEEIDTIMQRVATLQDVVNFKPDTPYTPVARSSDHTPPSPDTSSEKIVVIRGMVEEARLRDLKAHTSVVKV